MFEWKQESYLLEVDYYSRFIEIAIQTSTYSSSEFNQFASDYKFNHITSSPYFPQANGEAERAVQTVKELLKLSIYLYLALFAYHSTPLKLGYSLAKLLMGRALRTTIPFPLEQLQSKLSNSKELRKKDKELKKLSRKKMMINRHKISKQDILETEMKYGYRIKEFLEEWKMNKDQIDIKFEHQQELLFEIDVT